MRLNQIDVLKGIGILLVMLGHAFPQRGLFYEIIYSFHMPLFLLVLVFSLEIII